MEDKEFEHRKIMVVAYYNAAIEVLTASRDILAAGLEYLPVAESLPEHLAGRCQNYWSLIAGTVRKEIVRTLRVLQTEDEKTRDDIVYKQGLWHEYIQTYTELYPNDSTIDDAVKRGRQRIVKLLRSETAQIDYDLMLDAKNFHPPPVLKQIDDIFFLYRVHAVETAGETAVELVRSFVRWRKKETVIEEYGMWLRAAEEGLLKKLPYRGGWLKIYRNKLKAAGLKQG